MVMTAGELLFNETRAAGARPGVCRIVNVGSDQDKVSVSPLIE